MQNPTHFPDEYFIVESKTSIFESVWEFCYDLPWPSNDKPSQESHDSGKHADNKETGWQKMTEIKLLIDFLSCFLRKCSNRVWHAIKVDWVYSTHIIVMMSKLVIGYRFGASCLTCLVSRYSPLIRNKRASIERERTPDLMTHRQCSSLQIHL